MRRFFVYEFVTAGGGGPALWETGPSLLAEGSAMLRAVSADLASLAAAEVWVMRHSRLPAVEWPGCHSFAVTGEDQEQALFGRLAREADHTMVIAPETGGALLWRCRLAEAVGGRLLSPSAACVEVAANKQATAEHLACRGIPVPAGYALTTDNGGAADGTNRPQVVKPVDGCGSQGVRLIRSTDELATLAHDGSWRIERFIEGQAVSVAVLCGAAGCFALPACEQRLSTDGCFAYLGGRLPLEPGVNGRAQALAVAAVRSLPAARGYLGVDLVLGDAADGRADYVIEINPRLTTSYLGLRALSQENLAAAMVAVCAGEAPDLRFAEGPIEFSAEGMVQEMTSGLFAR